MPAEIVNHMNPGESFFKVSSAKTDLTELAKEAAKHREWLIAEVLKHDPAIGNRYSPELVENDNGSYVWNLDKIHTADTQALRNVDTVLTNYNELVKDGTDPRTGGSFRHR